MLLKLFTALDSDFDPGNLDSNQHMPVNNGGTSDNSVNEENEEISDLKEQQKHGRLRRQPQVHSC